MPEYTTQQVDFVTRFINARFTQYYVNANAVFDENLSSTIREGSVHYTNLYYTITVGFNGDNYVLYAFLQFNRVSNKIELISRGSGTMPFGKMVSIAGRLMESYIDFEVRKENNILAGLQDLPYTRTL